MEQPTDAIHRLKEAPVICPPMYRAFVEVNVFDRDTLLTYIEALEGQVERLNRILYSPPDTE